MTVCNRISLLALVALVVCGSVSAQVPDNSRIRLDPDDALSDAYRETLQVGDAARLDNARTAGDSFLPTVYGAPTVEQRKSLGSSLQAEGDILIRRPSEAVEGDARVHAYRTQETPVTKPVLAEPVARNLSGLLQVLISEWSRTPEIVALVYPDPVLSPEPIPAHAEAALQTTGESPATRQPLYARTLYAVRSDTPGPVLVEILEPPLDGAVLSGGFDVVNDSVVLRLTTMERNGARVAVDAWAVDLECGCFNIAGDVDHHWFERVVLPAAMQFAGGWLEASSEPATTISVNGNVFVATTDQPYGNRALARGAADAFSAVADVLDESAPAGSTVSLPRDTRLGVVILRVDDGIR